jgi:hypothetical protein
LRSRIEDLTDTLADEAWRTLSDDDRKEVTAVAMVIRERAAGLFPAAHSARGCGEHR